MSDQKQYIEKRARQGLVWVALGVAVFTLGLALQWVDWLPFDARILGGVGIFLIGVGLAQALRYRLVRGDQQAAARLVNEERDERNRMIRAQAGNRAFWVSLALTYAALLWLSFAENGALPQPSPDGLWLYLAGAVVISFVVYTLGIISGQKRS